MASTGALKMGNRKCVPYLKWGSSAVLCTCSVPIQPHCVPAEELKICPTCLPATSRQRKARTQCWFPTPRLCSIFQSITCMHKYSLVTYYWYMYLITEGSSWLTTSNSIKILEVGPWGNWSRYISNVGAWILPFTKLTNMGVQERCMAKWTTRFTLCQLHLP